MTGETDDLRNTIAAIVSDAQDWDNGTEPYVERIMGAIAAERERQAAELRDPWRPIDDEARNGDLWLLRHRDGRRSAGRYIEHIDVFSVVGGEHWTADRVTECAPLPTPTADKEG